MRPVSRVLIVLAAVILLILLSACGTKTAPLAPDAPNVVQTVADIELPTHLQHLSEQTRLSYQLAVVYSEELSQVPCYCGCGAEHRHVRDCFVRELSNNGAIVWDRHGSGCGICQGIVLDSVRLLNEGKTIADVQQYIDQHYSQYAPPTGGGSG
jgi:hypothetical protein